MSPQETARALLELLQPPGPKRRFRLHEREIRATGIWLYCQVMGWTDIKKSEIRKMRREQIIGTFEDLASGRMPVAFASLVTRANEEYDPFEQHVPKLPHQGLQGRLSLFVAVHGAPAWKITYALGEHLYRERIEAPTLQEAKVRFVNRLREGASKRRGGPPPTKPSPPVSEKVVNQMLSEVRAVIVSDTPTHEEVRQVAG